MHFSPRLPASIGGCLVHFFRRNPGRISSLTGREFACRAASNAASCRSPCRLDRNHARVARSRREISPKTVSRSRFPSIRCKGLILFVKCSERLGLGLEFLQSGFQDRSHRRRRAEQADHRSTDKSGGQRKPALVRLVVKPQRLTLQPARDPVAHRLFGNLQPNREVEGCSTLLQNFVQPLRLASLCAEIHRTQTHPCHEAPANLRSVQQ